MAVTIENIIVMSVIVLVGIALAIAMFMIFYEQQKKFLFPIFLSLIILVIFGMGLGVYILNTNIITGSEISEAFRAIRNIIDPGQSCIDIADCNPGIEQVTGLFINDYFKYPYICDNGSCKLRPGNNTCKLNTDCSKIAPICTDGICTNYSTKSDYGEVGNAAILNVTTGDLTCKTPNTLVLNSIFPGQSISNLSTLCIFPSYDQVPANGSRVYTCAVNGVKSTTSITDIFCYVGLCDSSSKICLNKGLGQQCGIRDNNPYLDECGDRKYCSIYSTNKGAEVGTCQFPDKKARYNGAYCINDSQCDSSTCVKNTCIGSNSILTLLDNCIPETDSCFLANLYDTQDPPTIKCSNSFFCQLTSKSPAEIEVYNSSIGQAYITYLQSGDLPRIKFYNNTSLYSYLFINYITPDKLFFNYDIIPKLNDIGTYYRFEEIVKEGTDGPTCSQEAFNDGINGYLFCPILNLNLIRTINSQTVSNTTQISINSYDSLFAIDAGSTKPISRFDFATITPLNYGYIYFNGNNRTILLVLKWENFTSFNTIQIVEGRIRFYSGTNQYYKGSGDPIELKGRTMGSVTATEKLYLFGSSSNYGIYYDEKDANNFHIHLPTMVKDGNFFKDTAIFINDQLGGQYQQKLIDSLNKDEILSLKGNNGLNKYIIKENFILSSLPEGVVYLTRSHRYVDGNIFLNEYELVIKKYQKNELGEYEYNEQRVTIGSGFSNRISLLREGSLLPIIYDLKTDVNNYELYLQDINAEKSFTSPLYHSNRFIFYGEYAGTFGLFYGLVNYTKSNRLLTANFKITAAPDIYEFNQFIVNKTTEVIVRLEKNTGELIKQINTMVIKFFADNLVAGLIDQNPTYKPGGNNGSDKISYNIYSILGKRAGNALPDAGIQVLSSVLRYFNSYPLLRTINKNT